ncbi:cypmaclein-like [Corylus avellana]|uniref:cypmaclein-like n=1 Tax=Corylus avellana TaxID=13451 RepID=UPI00286A1C7B|nr:cypmaclein-like [Corylus avellana]
MACTKTRFMSTIIFFILILHEMGISSGRQLIKEQMIDCNGKCGYRCSKASRHKMCIRACNSCCQRCNCVPPGTYGNYNACPCYANMTTHGGRHKCP